MSERALSERVLSERALVARDSPTTVWLRRLAPATEPWARLVCFPHAGGSAAFFCRWRHHLPPGIELFAVQYPGRLDRVTDPCLDDMDLLAESVTAAVAPLLDRPAALFGHSLGAAVAYEVARRLPGSGRRALERLFVSGRAAPDRQDVTVVHLASDDALCEEIARLGGTRPEVLADLDLRRAFLPALRSDYRLSAHYRARPGPPLECPVTALLGDDDTEVDAAQARRWSGFTRAGFSIRTFPGEHFYLTTQMSEVVDEVVRGLAHTAPQRCSGWAGP